MVNHYSFQNYNFQQFEVFPTHILRFNCKHIISSSEVSSLKTSIDSYISNFKYIQDDELTPKWQSIPMLFKQGITDNILWKKIKESFINSCYQYISIVENFSNNQKALTITDVRAWFYKRDFTTSEEKNPWHSHYPSFLSGVFYLDSSHTEQGGTEFNDPRTGPSTSTRTIEIISDQLTWVIFPGWLTHRSGKIIDNNVERYVIAADAYVAVNS